MDRGAAGRPTAMLSGAHKEAPTVNWPLTGVLAAIAIAAGIVLLVAYAVGRGLVHHALPDTVESPGVPTETPAHAAEPRNGSRALGAVGALVLILGLALGVLTAATSWGGVGTGGAGADCAQSWLGCPQATAPAASPGPPQSSAP